MPSEASAVTGDRQRAMWRKAGGVICVAGVAGFLMVVIPLHLVQSDYNPWHQMMSELALGPHGQFMLLAFASIAAAFGGMAMGLAASNTPRFMSILAATAGLTFLGAGIFRLDNAIEMHVALIATAFVLSGLAMYLLPACVPGASRAGSWTLGAATAISVLSGHLFMPMGLAQRLAAACILIWLCWVVRSILKK